MIFFFFFWREKVFSFFVFVRLKFDFTILFFSLSASFFSLQ